MTLVRCLLLLSLIVTLNAQADSVATTPIQSSTVVNSTIGTAQDWHLSSVEWQSYQKLMAGPAGKWYPQLSPAEILGLYADNITDQNHFAEVAAVEQHDKITREIAFNNAFTAAMHRLYDHEPVIKEFNMSAFNPIKTVP